MTDVYEDFDRLRTLAESMGYRLWKWHGWHVSREGAYVKRWVNCFDAATIEAWLTAKAADKMKYHPLTEAQREALK